MTWVGIPAASSRVPIAACSRRREPSPIGLPILGENAVLVIVPASFPSYRSFVPIAGASAAINCNSVNLRFTWPRDRTRSTISCPV